ncbi:MAG: hypothetical protein J7M38_02260 [Armatimonadetes bacterium]|nr:hypothetical protein [Armatimonadota bacterium]
MKAAHITSAALFVIMAVMVTGCGGGGGGGGTQSDLNSYLPMAAGNNWTYDLRIRADLNPAQEHPGWNNFVQTEEITGHAQLQGTDYFVFQTVREAAGEFPEARWTQYRRADNLGIYVRDLVQAVDVALLHTPPHTGDTWADPTNEDITYETVATAEQVTVPAGTFDCAVVKMTDNTPNPDHPERVPFTVRTWFAKGVGIVQDRTYEGPTEDMTTELQLRDYEIL